MRRQIAEVIALKRSVHIQQRTPSYYITAKIKQLEIRTNI